MEIDHRFIGEDDISDMIPLFIKVDEFATGKTYDASTADMGRKWLFDDASQEEVSDSEALDAYLTEFCDEVIIAKDDETETYIGFTAISINDEWFAEEHPKYTPNIGVWISGVHPEYQRQGVWTALRKYVEDEVCPNRDADYLITEADSENLASQKANESRGMREVKEEDESAVYVQDI